MTWIDWLIFLIPMAGVMVLGYWSRRYIRGVVDFLSAGRLCGRYLLTVGDIANGISIAGVLSYVERKYAAGFAVEFWNRLLLPISITLALCGYCIYRFRETRCQSAGEFLEIRYGSKPFRFYFSFVRVLAEMLAHSIMPALAARFFIYFLGLPETFTLLGITFDTFVFTMVACASLGILLICFGGLLTIVLTDTIQGLLCIPVMVLIGVYLLSKLDWSGQILPVLADRIKGESFINSFDVSHVRDFNLFAIGVSLFNMFMHRATWLGGGASGAAKSPHEQKMASLLGQWRGFLGSLLHLLVTLAAIVMLNHSDFAMTARNIRIEVASRVTRDIVQDASTRQRMEEAFYAIPEQRHVIGQDKPLSKERNLDTPYIEAARQVLVDSKEGAGKVQQFRSLFHQQMVSVTMRHLFCAGMLGLFALLMALAMVSTDDSYIFSSAIAISQDLVLPFFKKAPSPRLHIWILRLSAIFVGLFFLTCCICFAQMDYIELFRMTVLPMYLGGCGPVLIFGLYSRFGTRQGAWASMLSGMTFALLYIVLQRNWADTIYPWLAANGHAERVGAILWNLSKPLQPWIEWKMNTYKIPVNAYEAYAFNMLFSAILYIVVSKITCKEPFNLERMLHRGEYSLDDGKKSAPQKAPLIRRFLNLATGITPEHTFVDKCISWSLVVYVYLYSFLGTFIGVTVWNIFFPWGNRGWGNYFLTTFIIVPMVMATVTAVWFWIGGILDVKNLFRSLKERKVDVNDNGMVQNGRRAADAEKDTGASAPGTEQKMEKRQNDA